MKIGIMGTRGIPNRYGGFEQFADWLSAGLAARGHKVFVYSPHHHPYQDKKLGLVNIIHCRDPEKWMATAGQFIYDRNCLNDSIKRGFDVLLHLGYTSDSIWWRRWPKKTIHIVNMDGLEWSRAKYSRLTRKFLRRAESLAVKHASEIIADSRVIQRYYQTQYNHLPVFIPYGAGLVTNFDKKLLEKSNLLPGCYFMVMARMEPENNIEMIIEGWIGSGHKDPLILFGNTNNKFGNGLRKKYSVPGLIFAGPNYDQTEINSLRHFSSIYFHGHSVGGTNPSLLEAMACMSRIAAHENEFNREVLGGDADFFRNAEDVESIIRSHTDPEIIEQRKKMNSEKIRLNYQKSMVIQEYEDLMSRLVNSNSANPV